MWKGKHFQFYSRFVTWCIKFNVDIGKCLLNGPFRYVGIVSLVNAYPGYKIIKVDY